MKWSLQTRISISISRLLLPNRRCMVKSTFYSVVLSAFYSSHLHEQQEPLELFLEKPCFSYSQSERLERVNYTKHAHLSFLPVSELCWGHVLQRGAGAVCTVSLRDLPGHGGPVVLRAVSQHWSTGRRWSQERVPVWRWVTPNRKL